MTGLSGELDDIRVEPAESLCEKKRHRGVEAFVCATLSAVTATEVYLAWHDSGELDFKLTTVALGCAALSGKLFLDWHDLRKP